MNKADKLSIAIEALEFYAECGHYDENDYGGIPANPQILDKGEEAREALEKIKQDDSWGFKIWDHKLTDKDMG